MNSKGAIRRILVHRPARAHCKIGRLGFRPAYFFALAGDPDDLADTCFPKIGGKETVLTYVTAKPVSGLHHAPLVTAATGHSV